MNDFIICQFCEVVFMVEDYCQLCVFVGFSVKFCEVVVCVLFNMLFGVCVYQGVELVVMGCIVGDGGCYLQVCDIVVLSWLQGQGFGKEVMWWLDGWMQVNLLLLVYVSLLVDGEVYWLYVQFGFVLIVLVLIGMYWWF